MEHWGLLSINDMGGPLNRMAKFQSTTIMQYCAHFYTELLVTDRGADVGSMYSC